jgi:tetratricopeptide (TPR) repeat protein
MGMAVLLMSSAVWAAFCIKCGKKMLDEAKFCPACGHQAGKLLEPKPKKAPPKPKKAPSFQAIEEANNYFELAEKERNSTGAFVLPFVKRKRYQRALELYLTILKKWPASDKCEASAYRAGQVYESISHTNWDQAIKHYRMVVQINPDTTMDARYRIARITEKKILDYSRAQLMYEDCIANARVQTEKEKAAKALRKLKEKNEKAQNRLTP